MTTSGLAKLAGIGPQTARKFADLGIDMPEQLLTHIPRAYRDWRHPSPIGTVPDGEAIVVGRIDSVSERNGRFPMVSALVSDGTGSMKLTWFGRRHLFGRLQVGNRIFASGRVARKGFVAEMNVTSHREMAPDERFVGEIVPIYPAGKELPSRTIRSAILRNLDLLVNQRGDLLPAEVARAHGFVSAREAWYGLHAPHSPDEAERSRRRVIFEEFFVIGLDAALKRAQREAAGGAVPIVAPADWLERFAAQLPFALTGAQRRVIEEVASDVARGVPMNRLLQGDVGSGKTLVAAAAMYLAHVGGMQSALMAPTEILATQHAAKLAPLLQPLGIGVEVVLGSQSARERRRAVERLASGEAGVAVGTHALLTESVSFDRFGLAIVDEQHRFGVRQRLQLRAKSANPHALYMSATPIPRTLAQTKYAELDVSIIDELPPGRTPIRTFLLRRSRIARVYEFVRLAVARGGQAYVVAPAIESGESGMTSAVDEAERLRTTVFPHLRVDVLHGKMLPREKDAAMEAFARGETQVLVATTVVEVGVDVPNASVMVILDAHRFGLATLHQLRGRVGRGASESFCLLVAPDAAAEAERLTILERTTDGFEIAQADLEIRRSGELLGTAQAGGDEGTIGDLIDDFELYVEAKAAAQALLARDPALQDPEHAGLVRALARLGERAALVSA